MTDPPSRFGNVTLEPGTALPREKLAQSTLPLASGAAFAISIWEARAGVSCSTGSTTPPPDIHSDSTLLPTIRRLLAAALIAMLATGCAQVPPSDRDLNAEAIRQMSYWGGEPGF